MQQGNTLCQHVRMCFLGVFLRGPVPPAVGLSRAGRLNCRASKSQHYSETHSCKTKVIRRIFIIMCERTFTSKSHADTNEVTHSNTLPPMWMVLQELRNLAAGCFPHSSVNHSSVTLEREEGPRAERHTLRVDSSFSGWKSAKNILY